MSAAFTIDPENGHIHIDGTPFVITASTTHDEARRGLASVLVEESDMKNGFVWENVDGLSLGEQPAGLSLCFGPHGLKQVSFWVTLPDQETKDGWPTQDAIDREIAFVRGALGTMWKRAFPGTRVFRWGSVWANLDVFAYAATAGLRYAAYEARA